MDKTADERCRLCRREQPLLQSHVIPELLYRPLYGPTHQIRSVDADLPIRLLRKGLREPMLCGDCEVRLGKHESYFASVWLGNQALKELPEPFIGVVRQGLDYASFKLFHLSILWRCSVATLPEFRGVALGPHEDRMREMILGGDPGLPSDYPIAACVLIRAGSIETHGGVVSVPIRQRHGSGSVYSAVYAGCLWLLFISPNMTVKYEVLGSDGSLALGSVDVRDVASIYPQVARAGSWRRGSSKRADPPSAR
jgi:hypothetical protein